MYQKTTVPGDGTIFLKYLSYKNMFNENISIKVSNLKESLTQTSPNPQEKDTKGQRKIYCEF